MSEVTSHIVCNKDVDLRLDRWFKVEYPDLPFGRLQKLIRNKEIRVNNKRTSTNYRLQESDIIRIPPLYSQPKVIKSVKKVPAAIQKKIKESILFQDEHIVVINKPQGIAVQGGKNIPYSIDDMLINLCDNPTDEPKLVHRLDKDTSGLLLIAKNRLVANFVSALLQEKKIHKTYLALVKGVPNPTKGTIESYLSKEETAYDVEKMVSSDNRGKEAITYYEVLDHVGKDYALMKLQPLTGRTHQLRVHMLELGCPILGDSKYDPHYRDTRSFEKLLMLHAYKLNIATSESLPSYAFTAPVNNRFQSHLMHFNFQL